MKLRLWVAIGLLFSIGAWADENNGELEVKPLIDQVWLHISYQRLQDQSWMPSNGLVVANGKDAYLIDTPWSETDTDKLLNWLSEQGLMLKAVVITHFHSDRNAGLQQLINLGIPTYASAKTNALLQQEGRASAKNAFEADTFELEPGLIEIFYPGPGHSLDNHVVWLQGSKVVFGGCLVRAQGANDLGNTADADIEQWAQSVMAVKDRYPTAQFVVPGHGEVGGLELIDHTATQVQLEQMGNALEFTN